MRGKDLGIDVKGSRSANGGWELSFSRVHLGFTGWLCTIRKEPGDWVEDTKFLHEPAIKAPGMFRIIHGLGEMNPVLRVADEKGNGLVLPWVGSETAGTHLSLCTQCHGG